MEGVISWLNRRDLPAHPKPRRFARHQVRAFRAIAMRFLGLVTALTCLLVLLNGSGLHVRAQDAGENATCLDAFVETVEPVSGGSVEFLGRNRDYATCGNADSVRLRDALTVELWAYFTDVSPYQHLVSKGGDFLLENDEAGDEGDAYECAIFERRMYSRFKIDGAFEFLQGATTLQEKQWYFLAWTFDGEMLRYYVNGVLDASVSNPGRIADVGKLYIGREAFYDGAYLNAMVDEVKIWNVARSLDEIRADAVPLDRPYPDSLVAYYDGSTDFISLLDQTENKNDCRFIGKDINVLLFQGREENTNIPLYGTDLVRGNRVPLWSPLDAPTSFSESRDNGTAYFSSSMAFVSAQPGLPPFVHTDMDGGVTGVSPLGMAISSDGKTLYVSAGDRGIGGIYKLELSDIRSPQVSGRVSLLVASVQGSQDRNPLEDSQNTLNAPIGMALDEPRGLLYVADRWNNRIYKVDTISGSVATLVGDGTYGFADGSRFEAKFQAPEDVALSLDGMTLYVADKDNNRIRTVDMNSWNVSTLAGGLFGFEDGPIGASVKFAFPNGVAASPDGQYVYVADSSNFRIRRVSTTDGATASLAGSDTITSAVDGVGPAAGFLNPTGIAISKDGSHLFVADAGAHSIRKIVLATASVTTLGGELFGSGGFRDNDPCNPTMTSRFDSPLFLDVYENGQETFVFAADTGNDLIRVLTDASSAECITPDDGGNGGISTTGIVLAAVFGGVGMLLLIAVIYFIHRALINRTGFVKRLPPREDEEVTIAVTDVQGSTVLWESFPEAMGVALALHDRLLRSLMYRHYGYESYTEGDSFTCVFHTAQDAINWSLDVQRELLDAAWAPEIVDQSVVPGLVTNKSGHILFRGLRVRIALNTGLPLSRYKSESNGRYVYEGSVLETVKLIANAPAGGQIIMGESVLKEDIDLSTPNARIVHMGEHELSDGFKSLNLYMLTPNELKERELLFPKLRTAKTMSPSFFEAPCALPLSSKESVTIVFMEVHRLANIELWNKEKAEAALDQLQVHCIRPLSQHFDGYECEALHGKFVYAFKSPTQALLFAATVHVQAMELDWDPDLLDTEEAGEMYIYDSKGNERLVYRGLQVSVGACEGRPNDCQPHSTTGRALYTGPVMNRAARVLQMAGGGQVLLTGSCLLGMDVEKETEPAKALATLCKFKHMGIFALKGLRESLPVLQMIVRPLEERPQRPTKARGIAPPPAKAESLRSTVDHVRVLAQRLEFFDSHGEDDFNDGIVKTGTFKTLWPSGLSFLKSGSYLRRSSSNNSTGTGRHRKTSGKEFKRQHSLEGSTQDAAFERGNSFVSDSVASTDKS